MARSRSVDQFGAVLLLAILLDAELLLLLAILLDAELLLLLAILLDAELLLLLAIVAHTDARPPRTVQMRR
jgi:hypothetical protein